MSKATEKTKEAATEATETAAEMQQTTAKEPAPSSSLRRHPGGIPTASDLQASFRTASEARPGAARNRKDGIIQEYLLQTGGRRN